MKHRISCCMKTLAASQFPFELRIANEVHALNQTDPILRRVAALTTTASSEETGVTAIRTGDVTTDATPENVARRWMVGWRLQRTPCLKVTTQQGIRSIPNPATRRFKTQMAHLRYYPRLRGMFYAEIMEPKIKSVDSHQYAHVIGKTEEILRLTRWSERTSRFTR